MNIGVIGVGRLGICFALLLDRGGYNVMGCDIRTNYISSLNRRQIQTNEPLVSDMLKDSKIRFTPDARSVIESSEIIYIMVATPSLADGSYDVSAVWRVVDDLAECDFDISGKILVVGCTTNPGDCQEIQDTLRDRGVHVLYNPEFIAQGSILRDLQNADMVLIGGEDPEVIDRYQQVYYKIQPVITPNIQTMSLTAAELVKIGINCFLTTKISYANMMGEILTRSGVANDIDRALTAIGSDTRIGYKYMNYGLGYGGPCLPRDNRALARHAKMLGLEFPLGSIVDQFNQDHTEFVLQQILEDNQEQHPFYIRYISYKPNTDIFDESQQLKLCLRLLDLGHRVYIEPSDLIPNAIKEHLHNRYKHVAFQSLNEIKQSGKQIYEIRI